MTRPLAGETTLKLIGNAPQLRSTGQGQAVATLTLVNTQRVFDRPHAELLRRLRRRGIGTAGS